jgi:hypothetical protein
MSTVRCVLQTVLAIGGFGFLSTSLWAFYRGTCPVIVQAETEAARIYTFLLAWSVIGIVVALALLAIGGALRISEPSPAGPSVISRAWSRLSRPRHP